MSAWADLESYESEVSEAGNGPNGLFKVIDCAHKFGVVGGVAAQQCKAYLLFAKTMLTANMKDKWEISDGETEQELTND